MTTQDPKNFRATAEFLLEQAGWLKVYESNAGPHLQKQLGWAHIDSPNAHWTVLSFEQAWESYRTGICPVATESRPA